MRTPIVMLAALLVFAGCSTRPYNERYVADRTDLDQKTREAILEHRVILGMFPDEAIAAAGQCKTAVKAGDNTCALRI